MQATATSDGKPQAAVVGFAVTDDLEFVFDTLKQSRKAQNLLTNRHVALVIGWDDEITVQVEGLADFPSGDDLHRIQQCYFDVYPDGRERLLWDGITHVRVTATWVKYSDFTQDPPLVIEMSADQLLD